ncbi:hypothetical protein HMPREF3092_09905 [Brevibacterium sp. HMSC24B04]|nr:hypothetical protein HMPREF3092_09905 [Brevibacterium sp. HMSC24B04]
MHRNNTVFYVEIHIVFTQHVGEQAEFGSGPRWIPQGSEILRPRWSGDFRIKKTGAQQMLCAGISVVQMPR